MKTTIYGNKEVEVVLGGDITGETAHVFTDTVAALYQEGNTKFNFDFAEVAELDPVALATMLVLCKKLEGAEDAVVRVRSMVDEVGQALQAFGLGEVLELEGGVEEEEEEALA